MKRYEDLSESELEYWAEHISHCMAGEAAFKNEIDATDDDLEEMMEKFECFKCTNCDNWCPPEDEACSADIEDAGLDPEDRICEDCI